MAGGVCRPRKVIFGNMTREVEMSGREDNSKDRSRAQSNSCFPSVPSRMFLKDTVCNCRLFFLGRKIEGVMGGG